MRPTPVVRVFYGLAYLVALGETCWRFLNHGLEFSREHFPRDGDAITIFWMFVFFVSSLTCFLAVNYLVIEQFENSEGVFHGFRFSSSFRKNGELVLRLLLFAVMSLKIIKFEAGIEEAAIYSLTVLGLYIVWFLWITTSSCEDFNDANGFVSLRWVAICASFVLIFFGASYFNYNGSSKYVLLFMFGFVSIGSALLIKTGMLVALFFRHHTRKASELAPAQSG